MESCTYIFSMIKENLFEKRNTNHTGNWIIKIFFVVIKTYLNGILNNYFLKESLGSCRFVFEFRFFRSQKNPRSTSLHILQRGKYVGKMFCARVVEGLDTGLKGVLTRSSSCGTPKLQTPAKRASPSGRAIHICNCMKIARYGENCRYGASCPRSNAFTNISVFTSLRLVHCAVNANRGRLNRDLLRHRWSIRYWGRETYFFNTLLSSKYSSENTFCTLHEDIFKCPTTGKSNENNKKIKLNKTRIIDEKERIWYSENYRENF